MRKVVVAGGLTLAIKGLGDDAQLTVLCQGLRQRIPDVEITCLSRHPSRAYGRQFGVRSIKNLDFDNRQQSVGRWFRGLNPEDPTDHLVDIARSIEAADLLVIGGDPFIDLTLGFLKGPTPFAALLVTLAKFMQTPIMIYGAHISYPLATDSGREMTRFCVGNADLVTVREAFSERELNDLGIDSRNIRLLADPAFGLDPSRSKEMGLRILEKEGIRPTARPMVGISFRHMEWRWSRGEFERCATIMAQVCDQMIAEMGVDVLFIPQCTYHVDDPLEDDRGAADYVWRQINQKEHAHCIRHEHPLEEMLSLYRIIDMIVSSKRHSLIFGAVHCIPTVGIGSPGHMASILEELSLDDCFVNTDQLGTELLREKVFQAWRDRDIIAQKIKNALPELRSKALEHSILAADLTEKGTIANLQP